jgi:hypothetical protein
MEAEMSKFKVGDRVRYLPCKGSGQDWQNVTITKIESTGGYWGDDDDEQWRDGLFFEHQLELIDEPTPAIDAHYTKYSIQPMEFSLANGLDPAQHTVIKYVVRYRDKGGVRDLKAAIRVLELMIERAERADV